MPQEPFSTMLLDPANPPQVKYWADEFQVDPSDIKAAIPFAGRRLTNTPQNGDTHCYELSNRRPNITMWTSRSCLMINREPRAIHVPGGSNSINPVPPHF